MVAFGLKNWAPVLSASLKQRALVTTPEVWRALSEAAEQRPSPDASGGVADTSARTVVGDAGEKSTLHGSSDTETVATLMDSDTSSVPSSPSVSTLISVADTAMAGSADVADIINRIELDAAELRTKRAPPCHRPNKQQRSWPGQAKRSPSSPCLSSRSAICPSVRPLPSSNTSTCASTCASPLPLSRSPSSNLIEEEICDEDAYAAAWAESAGLGADIPLARNARYGCGTESAPAACGSARQVPSTPRSLSSANALTSPRSTVDRLRASANTSLVASARTHAIAVSVAQTSPSFTPPTACGRSTHTTQRNPIVRHRECADAAAVPACAPEGVEATHAVEQTVSPQETPRMMENPEATAHLAQLLEYWKTKRHSADALDEKEMSSVSDIVFDTMPSDRVNIVSVSRLQQPELLRKFCQEEQDSVALEQRGQKFHREYMYLHGTRWENVPLIQANGLDPDCGHLSSGIWLGGRAESAHQYAKKGPGPEQENGHMLFATFVVACLPNVNGGDQERGFGVWRMMSGARMYPAYLVIYSAPLDIRVKNPFPAPRMNRSVEVLMSSRSSARTPRSPMEAASPRLLEPSKIPKVVCEEPTPQPVDLHTSSDQLRKDVVQRAPASTRLRSEPRSGPVKEPVATVAANWEVELGDRWAPFQPDGRFNDQPGTAQDLVIGKFWCRISFNADGMTGLQTNQSTGKARRLRRSLA